MEYQVVGLNEINTGFNFNTIVKKDEDNVLRFSLSDLGKPVVKSDKIYTELNLYLKTFTSIEQDAMFDILVNIKKLLDSIYPSEVMFNKIRVLTTEYLNYFDFNKVREFVIRARIPIPENFVETFTKDITKNITRDKTYTHNDYIDLVTLIIILKSVFPIFSHYTGVIKDEIGKQYKETYVFGIISKSKFNNHPALNKLHQYILATVGINDFDDTTNAIKGMNIDEFIDTLIAKTMIRKLLVSDLQDTNVNHNLITYVYKYMNQIKKDHDNKTHDNVVIKEPISASDSENTLSILEQFKLKEDVSIGDVVTLEHYISNTSRLISQVYPNIDYSLLEEFSHYVKLLEKENIYHPQINILRIMLRNVISYRSILHLPRPVIITLMTICATILWQNDLKFLSVLLCSTTKESREQMLSTVGSRGRLSPELIDELNVLYPYKYVSRDSNFNKAKPVNPAIDSIDRLINSFSDYIWYSTFSKPRIKEANNDENYDDIRLIIPHAIRNDIARMYILAYNLGRKGDING